MRLFLRFWGFSGVREGFWLLLGIGFLRLGLLFGLSEILTGIYVFLDGLFFVILLSFLKFFNVIKLQFFHVWPDWSISLNSLWHLDLGFHPSLVWNDSFWLLLLEFLWLLQVVHEGCLVMVWEYNLL